MRFNDGELTGRDCPKCDTPLIFYVACCDAIDGNGNHTTHDYSIEYCDACDYEREYEPSIDMEDD